MYMESCNLWPSASGLSHSASCFRDLSESQCGSVLHSLSLPNTVPWWGCTAFWKPPWSARPVQVSLQNLGSSYVFNSTRSTPNRFTQRKMTIHRFTVSRYKHDLVYSVKNTRSQAGCDQLLCVLVCLMLVLAPWELGAGFRTGVVHSGAGRGVQECWRLPTWAR